MTIASGCTAILGDFTISSTVENVEPDAGSGLDASSDTGLGTDGAVVPDDSGSPDGGACAPGTWDPDGNPATPCVPWRDCVAGTRVLTPGTLTSDRVCESCAAESFTNEPNQASCMPWKDCQPGTYVRQEASSSKDRTCSACPPGTLSTYPNQASCTAANECAAGTVQTSPGSGTSNPTCAACEAGTYCAGGTAAKKTCANGTWDHDSQSATVCQPWKDCQPGTRVSNTPTPKVDRTCVSCGTGMVSRENATTCSQIAWTDWPMPNPANASLPNAVSYTVSTNVVVDKITNLEWQRAVTATTFASQGAAKTYCDNLVLDGKDDWRLPSRLELASIVDFTRVNPAIDTTAFPSTPSELYWTSSGEWFVDFGNGSAQLPFNSVARTRARCVR